MSKKKKKFNKAQILNQINKKESAPTTPTTINQVKTNNNEPIKQALDIDVADAKIAKKDLKKTAIIMSCLILVLLVIYYLSLRQLFVFLNLKYIHQSIHKILVYYYHLIHPL